MKFKLGDKLYRFDNDELNFASIELSDDRIICRINYVLDFSRDYDYETSSWIDDEFQLVTPLIKELL